MCGIAGILNSGAGGDRLRSVVETMVESLVHRGPDDGGVWFDPAHGIGLGQRRLSIIDLSPAGHQPMHSANGRFAIVYNGEVYNYLQLRRELAAAGHQFVGDSDTEVVLTAILAWGLKSALDRFVGMFAFALWDRQEQELTLVRDRLGIKPIYWGQTEAGTIFASELKAIIACKDWTPEIDRDALAAYMRWNYVPAPHTIYRGIQKLLPGTLVRLHHSRGPVIEHWWDLREIVCKAQANPLQASDTEAADLLETQLGDAVEQRMVSDVPLGAFLSGGIDSSTIVALMQSRRSLPVKTFTIGFEEPGYDEAIHARCVAEHLGTDHTELYVDPEAARDVIPKLPQIYDEPFADSSQLPTYLVSEMTRQHVTVALSGDGGDELFAGYTRYRWADLVWRHAAGIPWPLRRLGGRALGAVPAVVWEIVSRMLPVPRRPDRVAERARKLGEFLSEPDADAIYRRQHAHWSSPNSIVLEAQEPRGLAWDESLRKQLPDFVERMQFIDAMTYLPDDILTKVDRASMAVGLEVRVPVLDHRVVELAWSLRADQRCRHGESKWLLRKVLSRHVPEQMFARPKKGFSVPIDRWLRGPLRDWAEALLAEDRLHSDGYFAVSPVRHAWSDFISGRLAFQEPIWGLLMFQAWLDDQRNTA
ncbi:MAG: asparagine synthase (glutamine-hydrolyzing) [Alphaproteobacteria bacterium]|nr:asparagine synthase (glutamine-hydrolyzing) [Alphaproteobacteria bacterium]